MNFAHVEVLRSFAAAPLLLNGNDDANGYVFELYANATYAEIVRTDEPVIGAAGCMDDTAVALADRVVLLRKGFKPRLLLQLPSDSTPITSVRVCVSEMRRAFAADGPELVFRCIRKWPEVAAGQSSVTLHGVVFRFFMVRPATASA